MRIAQYTESFLPVVDGVGRVVASYAETMGRMGHEVTVMAPRADMGDTRSFPYSILTYDTIPMPKKVQYPIGFPQLDARFHHAAAKIPLDVVHVHSPFMAGRSGLKLAKKRGLPVIGSFHSKYYDDFLQILKMEGLAEIGVKTVVSFYDQCDEVWAVSVATGETLREYGFRGEVIPMPNGTDFRTLDESVLPELRARYGLQDRVPLLLFVGQMNWKKNIRHVFEAAKLLMRRDVPFRLLVAGRGPHEVEIQEAVSEMGLESCVTLTGHITGMRELDGLYALADLFVFPSLYDNAPMVLREAAVMGTPALLIDGSTAAEVIENGVNGLTCADTAEALADTIGRNVADLSMLKAMGKAAHETIPVSWTALMEQVLGRYERLIGIKAAR